MLSAVCRFIPCPLLAERVRDDSLQFNGAPDSLRQQHPLTLPSLRDGPRPLPLGEGFYWYMKLIGVSAAGRQPRSTALVGSWKKPRIILRTHGLLRETPWVALVTITTCEP